MDENKTQPTARPVAEFLATVEPAERRADGLTLAEIMTEVTGEPGQMWGASIVGYGTYHYVGKSGREGDWMKVGFSPRKAQLSLYGLKDSEEGAELVATLGKHTNGVGCVYVKRLEDIDLGVLRKLIDLGYRRDT